MQDETKREELKLKFKETEIVQTQITLESPVIRAGGFGNKDRTQHVVVTPKLCLPAQCICWITTFSSLECDGIWKTRPLKR